MKQQESAAQEARERHLVETDWLAARLAAGDPGLRVMDMRGYVRAQTDADGIQTADYLGAEEAYREGHIPGAIYLDWTRDIVDENDPVPAQVASAAKIARVLGEVGIGDDHLIVAYDAHPASQFATRLWWVLGYYGNRNVRVLNGGWAKWTQENRPVTTEVPHYPSAVFTPRPQPGWRATAEETLALLDKPGVTVLDARDEDQYMGRTRRGVRGGHIPGARHLPREVFFAPDGTFLPPDKLQSVVDTVGVTPHEQVVAYCNGGVAATSVLFTLSMLGYPHLTNYDGSWNEWNQRLDLPVEK